jgi:hypothetical protein
MVFWQVICTFHRAVFQSYQENLIGIFSFPNKTSFTSGLLPQLVPFNYSLLLENENKMAPLAYLSFYIALINMIMD